jgi:preprotein translocase subunit SecD
MDNQDKIFDKFKEAAQNSELKDFPGMEKVWSRVEDKLDKKEDKKTISLWKKIAIAASLLLLISLGTQFLISDKNKEIQNNQVVVTDSVEKKFENPVVVKDNAVAVEDSQIIPKEEAIKVLDKQIEQQRKVAVNEIKGSVSETTANAASTVAAPNEVFMPAPIQAEAEYSKEEISTEKDKAVQNFGYAKKTVQRQSAKVDFAGKQESLQAQKSAPLVVVNGNAMSHSDDAKKDKIMSDELPNLEPSNIESLVILDEPLYIIDGIYYSENDLFGPNPTSPYAPLDKQEIKTITILQDLEATSKYGEKGKKGVVIITTKTGKPINKK